MSPSPVTTQVPALRIAENACATCSGLVTPTVTIAESAPWPLVNCLASSVASSMDSKACVAPSSWAFSRLNATGSTAMMLDAPACAAPCTALMPMPPMPITITVCPGCTSAALTAEPQPVPTPQPTRQATSSGMSSGTFTAESADTVVVSQKVEMPHIWPTGPPPSASFSRKSVGSPQREPCSSPAPRSHRFCMPEAHQRQCPQEGRKEKTTWSPSLSPLVFSPALVTMPAPSCPPANG